MPSHLNAPPELKAPEGMHLGEAMEHLSPFERGALTASSLTLVNFYGAKGNLAPGFYLVNNLYARHGFPIAGPFESSKEALNALLSHQAYIRNISRTPEQRTLFTGHNSIMYQPSVVINPHALSIGNHCRIDSFCKLEAGEGMVIGDRVHIASFAHVGIGGGITILEEGSAVASHACVISGSNQPDEISCSPLTAPDQNRIERKMTVIKKNATLFVGAVVSPGVTIGEGARILPGAVITNDVPAGEWWAGVPARRIR